MDGVFHGIQAKLGRSGELLAALAGRLERLKEQAAFTIEGTNETERSRYAFRAIGNMPYDVPLLVSEILHHQRTVLDHLVWASVPLTGAMPTKQTRFPIALTKKTFEDAIGKGALDNVPLVLQELIERYQPYHNEINPSDHVLACLHRINNEDKHHMLLVIAAGLAMPDTIVAHGAVRTTIHLPPAGSGRPLHRAIENDVEVQWISYSPPHADTSFEVNFDVQIVLRDHQDWPLVHVLETIQNLVVEIADNFQRASEALRHGKNLRLDSGTVSLS